MVRELCLIAFDALGASTRFLIQAGPDDSNSHRVAALALSVEQSLSSYWDRRGFDSRRWLGFDFHCRRFNMLTNSATTGLKAFREAMRSADAPRPEPPKRSSQTCESVCVVASRGTSVQVCSMNQKTIGLRIPFGAMGFRLVEVSLP